MSHYHRAYTKASHSSRTSYEWMTYILQHVRIMTSSASWITSAAVACLLCLQHQSTNVSGLGPVSDNPTDSVSVCPSRCLCTTMATDRRVACDSAGLSDVPKSITPDVTSLDLGGNSLRALTGDSLGILPSLVQLKLNDNQLESIADGAFDGTAALQALDLSGNRLTRLTSSTFSGAAASLLHLDLSNNRLTTIDRAFSGMNELSRLDLRTNRLRALTPTTLADLHNVRHLFLADNHIRHVDAESFSDLEKLMFLVLTGNPLGGATINIEEWFGFKFAPLLSYTDLSECSLTSVPAGLPGALRYLQLRRNNISRVERDAFSGCPHLRILVLDENHINYIEPTAFQPLSSLQQLWLNYNRLYDMPRSLPASLKRLLIESNRLQEVNANAFPVGSDLETISFAGNLIRSLSPDALGVLTKMEMLDLSNNRVTRLAAQTFLNNTALNTLLLARNPLETFETGCFDGLMTLKKLSLAYIPFTQIISSSPSPSLSPSSSSPSFLSSSSDSLPSSPSSSTLFLDDDIFEDLESLAELDLDNSPSLVRRLIYSDDLLSSLVSVRDLSMRGSQLTSLRSDFAAFLPNLAVLHIASNRWHCDTELIWFRDWLTTDGPRGGTGRIATRPQDNVCYTPAGLRDRTVVGLSDAEFVGSSESRMAGLKDEDNYYPTVTVTTAKSAAVVKHSPRTALQSYPSVQSPFVTGKPLRTNTDSQTRPTDIPLRHHDGGNSPDVAPRRTKKPSLDIGRERSTRKEGDPEREGERPRERGRWTIQPSSKKTLSSAEEVLDGMNSSTIFTDFSAARVQHHLPLWEDLIADKLNPLVTRSSVDSHSTRRRGLSKTISSTEPSHLETSATANKRQNMIIISVVVTVLVTTIIVVIIVTLIVRLMSSDAAHDDHGEGVRGCGGCAKTEESGCAHQRPPVDFYNTNNSSTSSVDKKVVPPVAVSVAERYKSAASGNYFLISTSSCHRDDAVAADDGLGGSMTHVTSPEEINTPDVVRKDMSLIPGRDINHEGPLRVYKWTDF